MLEHSTDTWLTVTRIDFCFGITKLPVSQFLSDSWIFVPIVVKYVNHFENFISES